MTASSADRLRERLAANGDTLRMYTGETMYHVQVNYTCQLLDVVDEVADPATARLITDAIYERLSGDGVSEAVQRIREARVTLEQLARPGVVLPPRRNWVLVKGFHDSGAIDGVFGPYTKEHAEWLLNGMLDRTGFNWTLAEMQAAPG